MFENFDYDVIARALPSLFYYGMVFTLELTALAALGGVVVGTLIALMRLSGIKALQIIGAGYVNLVRSLPLLLVIFWFFFLVPLVPKWLGLSARPLPLPPFITALITFTMFEAAYFSEIMRAGIQSLPKGQVSAGFALGLPYRHVMSEVILPQAFRNMLPILLTQTIVLFQDTSLVYVLSLDDFLGVAYKTASRENRLVELLLFAGLTYFIISYLASTAVRILQARTAIIR